MGFVFICVSVARSIEVSPIATGLESVRSAYKKNVKGYKNVRGYKAHINVYKMHIRAHEVHMGAHVELVERQHHFSGSNYFRALILPGTMRVRVPKSSFIDSKAYEREQHIPTLPSAIIAITQ